MTENEAYGLVGALAGATNGWNEDAILVYVAEVRTWADLGAAQMAIADLCRTWTGDFKPTLGQVVEQYQRQLGESRRALPPPPRTTEHCDGTGWIVDDVGISTRRPCPRCNPYQADIFDDPRQWKRASVGIPSNDLHEQVEQVRARGMKKDGTMGLKDGAVMPPYCGVESRYERFPTWDEGRAIAFAGMMEDLEGASEERIAKAKARFDAIFAGLEGRSGPSSKSSSARPFAPVPEQAGIQDPAAQEFLDAASRLAEQLSDEEPF